MTNTPPQSETNPTEEFRIGITEMREGISTNTKNLTDLQTALRSVQDENARLTSDLDKVRRQLLAYPTSPTIRRAGYVSDHCARHLGAAFIIGNAKSGR